MKAPLSYVPALPAAVGLSTGIIANSLGFGTMTLLTGAVLFMYLYFRRRHYPALCFLMVAAGALLAISHHRRDAPELFVDTTHTYVAIVEETIESATTTSYIAKVTGVDGNSVQPFLTILTANTVTTPAQPGAIIKYNATLRNIGHKEEIPHETDYQNYLIAQGIMCRCILSGNVRQLAPPKGLDAVANTARDHVFNAIVDSPINGQTAAFLVASILGDRRFVTPDEYSEYRDTGVAHILALSGLHVGIIASMLAFLLFPLRLCRNGMYISSILTATLIWAYAVIAGMTPSIIRAAVMITIFMMARLIGRGANGFNSLCLAVVVILCFDPLSLFTPGFQLSVAAVATILMFGDLLPNRLRRYPMLYFVAGMVTTSVSAMIGTGIISAYYFNSFPLFFIAGNVVTGILFPMILGGGILLAVFTGMGISFVWLGAIVDWLHRLLQLGISITSSVDGSAMREIFFPAWVILPYALTVIMLALSLHYRKRALWMMTAASTACIFMVACLTKAQVPPAEMYMPSRLSPSSVIMRAGDKAWIYIAGEQHYSSTLDEANKRYRRFLLSRGCGLSFIPVTDTLNHRTFRVHDMLIVTPDKIIAVAGKKMPDVSSAPIHVDYALINADFRGTIKHVNDVLRPDTILLAPDIHPSRLKSLIRQCSDSIPYRNLRRQPLARTW